MRRANTCESTPITRKRPSQSPLGAHTYEAVCSFRVRAEFPDRHRPSREQDLASVRAIKRVGARSLGPFLSLSVRLSIGIISRPIFDPAPVGLVLWVLAGGLSRQHPAAAPAHHAGARAAARYRPGPGSPADGQGTASRPIRPRSPSAGVSRRRGACKIAMTPMMTSACNCDGDMPKPQKHAPARHCVRTTSGNPRSAAGSGRTMSPGRAQVRSSVRQSRPGDTWPGSGLGHADQCPVTSPVLTCQG